MAAPSRSPIETLFRQAVQPNKPLMSVEEFLAYRQAGLSATALIDGGRNPLECLLDRVQAPSITGLKEYDDAPLPWLTAILNDLKKDGPISWTGNLTVTRLPAEFVRPLVDAGLRDPGLFGSLVGTVPFGADAADLLMGLRILPTADHLERIRERLGESPLVDKNGHPVGALKWLLDYKFPVLGKRAPDGGVQVSPAGTSLVRKLWPDSRRTQAPAALGILWDAEPMSPTLARKMFPWDVLQDSKYVADFVAAHVVRGNPKEESDLLVALGRKDAAARLWDQGWRPSLAEDPTAGLGSPAESWSINNWVRIGFHHMGRRDEARLTDSSSTSKNASSDPQVRQELARRAAESARQDDYAAQVRDWLAQQVARPALIQAIARNCSSALPLVLQAEDVQSVTGQEPVVWSLIKDEAFLMEREHAFEQMAAGRSMKHRRTDKPGATRPGTEPSDLSVARSPLTKRLAELVSSGPAVVNPAGQTLPEALRAQGFHQMAQLLDPQPSVALVRDTARDRAQYLELAGRLFDDIQEMTSATKSRRPTPGSTDESTIDPGGWGLFGPLPDLGFGRGATARAIEFRESMRQFMRATDLLVHGQSPGQVRFMVQNQRRLGSLWDSGSSPAAVPAPSVPTDKSAPSRKVRSS